MSYEKEREIVENAFPPSVREVAIAEKGRGRLRGRRSSPRPQRFSYWVAEKERTFRERRKKRGKGLVFGMGEEEMEYYPLGGEKGERKERKCLLPKGNETSISEKKIVGGGKRISV